MKPNTQSKPNLKAAFTSFKDTSKAAHLQPCPSIHLKYIKQNGYLFTYITDSDKRYLRLVPFKKVQEQTAAEILEMIK
jgi:hypothetical protein